ncbi:MAG: hypothetical protein [Bacteriophage sp.]|nr:MAG: hypothetical protein [Bacteriophage sp.]
MSTLNEQNQWRVDTSGVVGVQRIAGYKPNNNWADLGKHLTYQLQETIEQVVAFNERNQEDYRDASSDVRVLLDAQQASVTWDLESDFNEVVSKLYTRFDATEEDALATQAKYAALGVETLIAQDPDTGRYVNKVAKSTRGQDGEYYPEGKFLKSVNFKLPEFALEPMQDTAEDKKIQVVQNKDTIAFIGTMDELVAYAQEYLANLEK